MKKNNTPYPDQKQKTLNIGGFADRLRHCVDKSGGLEALASASKLNKRTLSNYLMGKTEPKVSVASTIAHICGVSALWLLFGQGSDDTETSELTLIPYTKRQAEEEKSWFIQKRPRQAKFVFHHDWLNSMQLNESNAAVFLMEGDAMSPTLNDGDIALIDTSVKKIFCEGIYLIEAEGVNLIKRISISKNGVFLKSDNQNYLPDNLTYDDLDNVQILGRVRWLGRQI